MLLAITTIAVASAASVAWWQRSHMPVKAGTLEPVPATTSILIPGDDVGAVSPEGSTAPSAPASAPLASDPKQDGLSPPLVNVEQLTARVSSLEDTARTQAEQIIELRAAIDKRHADRDKSAEQARPLQASATPLRAVRSASSTSATPKQPTASVLAVDLWGGQPSVVVGKDGAGGTELRFISQGETQGRVTLKGADVANQRATFATSTGEFTMSVGDR